MGWCFCLHRIARQEQKLTFIPLLIARKALRGFYFASLVYISMNVFVNAMVGPPLDKKLVHSFVWRRSAFLIRAFSNPAALITLAKHLHMSDEDIEQVQRVLTGEKGRSAVRLISKLWNWLLLFYLARFLFYCA